MEKSLEGESLDRRKILSARLDIGKEEIRQVMQNLLNISGAIVAGTLILLGIEQGGDYLSIVAGVSALLTLILAIFGFLFHTHALATKDTNDYETLMIAPLERVQQLKNTGATKEAIERAARIVLIREKRFKASRSNEENRNALDKIFFVWFGIGVVCVMYGLMYHHLPDFLKQGQLPLVLVVPFLLYFLFYLLGKLSRRKEQ